jgi:RNA polymerase sigma-70 factor, ECF subfamily
MTLPSKDIEELAVPYQALRQGMLGFLRKHVNDPMAAEDLLQEVFMKALNAGKKGAAPGNIAGWLYRIARNSVIDYYRTRRPTEKLPELPAAEDSAGNPMEQALARCLQPLTEQLPPLYRDVLLAAEFEGKPLQSLAAEWGVSLSAVKSRASRGRILLKEKVSACCRIELSKTGSLVDFEKRPATGDCGGTDPCPPGCS